MLLCTEIITGSVLPRLYETLDRSITTRLDRSIMLMANGLRHRYPVGPEKRWDHNRAVPLVMND